MNIFILLSTTRGSQRAIGAFSARGKAEIFIDEYNIPDTQFGNFEVSEEIEAMPEMIFVAHKSVGKGYYMISGYYLKKFEATLTRGEGGYVQSLKIDEPDPEVLEEHLPETPGGATPPQFQTLGMESTPEASASEKMVKKRFHSFLIYGLFLFLLAANIAFYITTPGIEFAEHVSSVEWLPEEAEDISYYLSPRVKTYEFTISQPGFLDWAEKESLEVAPIGHQPLKLTRYTFDADVPIEGIENHTEEEQFEIWRNFTNAIFEKGYAIKNNAKEVNITLSGGYDSDNKRAYFRKVVR